MLFPLPIQVCSQITGPSFLKDLFKDQTPTEQVHRPGLGGQLLELILQLRKAGALCPFQPGHAPTTQSVSPPRCHACSPLCQPQRLSLLPPQQGTWLRMLLG